MTYMAGNQPAIQTNAGQENSTKSSLEVVPFKREHLFELKLQRAQAMFYEQFTPEYGYALEESGNCFTGLANGTPVVCAGVVEQWHGRGLAWALIAESAGPHFVVITRAVKRFLDIAPWQRIEAQVDAEFGRGIRWAEMLGFEVESKMSRFTPEGRDAFMFVRFK